MPTLPPDVQQSLVFADNLYERALARISQREDELQQKDQVLNLN
jgi:hypothetical protein